MEPALSPVDSLTPAQRRAVDARGNVLVMAGAGTGKTKTLVERCLDCLARERVSLDELLVVTFTEAAAAELRQRLRRELEKRAVAEPEDDHWPRQLAMFDLAAIGTLHSFCLKLIREHFYELGLDPQFTILDEGAARQCASETLEEQFQAHYEGTGPFSLAVQNLIQTHGNGRDENLRQLILRLHQYSQAQPDAAGWLATQNEHFALTEPVQWRRWLAKAINNWQNEWLPVLKNLRHENEKAAELADLLQQLTSNPPLATVAAILNQMAAANATVSYPKGRAGKLRPALGNIFEEAAFLASLVTIKNGTDPLAQDWDWVRGHMATLLQLAQEFAGLFQENKRRDGGLDFHDLEQFSLTLLWDFATNQPTPVARSWRSKLRFVFVDEYQDINAAQDKIIQALSGEGQTANRFLVGDVKQSIYRFRLADPKIFRDYARDWHGPGGETIPLSENFRSREGLLNFVNSVCGLVMQPEIGGVAYDDAAELKPGRHADAAGRGDTCPAETKARVELLLRGKTGRNEGREEEDNELAELNESQKEARLVALHLKHLISKATDRLKIWDDHSKALRPAEWRDIAILLRSPRGKSEIYAKEFERAGVPLAIARGGFYESAEILDLLSLLQLLDNPLQDVPCIAALRSPLVGLSLDELAEIRLTLRDRHFWTALNHSVERGMQNAETTAKLAQFLERYFRWRKLAKQSSLSDCLEAVLGETLYTDWLRAQPRGEQRANNVAGFLNLAQQFDQFQRQGLYRFLKFIEAEQAAEVEPEVLTNSTQDAVQLMSIHQSKGLEFPIVVLADLAKSFNEQDLRSEIIFDEEFGLCPKVKPPASGRRYPSLPHWLAQRRQKRELRGEELRLLYVALTRARDHLILTASITEKNWDEVWVDSKPVTSQHIAGAKSFADWMALWFAQTVPVANATSGENALLRWQLVTNEALANEMDSSPSDNGFRGRSPHQPLTGMEAKKLRTILEWHYPFTPATGRKAKSSVTALRRAAEEMDDEAEKLFPVRSFARSLKPKSDGAKQKLSAAEIGAAHHKFLQHVALEKAGEPAAEADRLTTETYLSVEERDALDLKALAHFWNAELGKKIRAKADYVRRELPFTARFSPAELENITGAQAEPGLKNEFIVVQGVADLVVLLPDEIWLVDFKTDAMSKADLPQKTRSYTPQLQLYAAALEKIFGRKVTLRALHFLTLRQTEFV